MIRFGREIAGELDLAERREWLCTNGLGGFASGTVAGTLTRRYHGLLVAALRPPVGRTLLAAQLDETSAYGGLATALGANRWANGTVAPQGFRALESFALEGTTPIWTYAVGDALLEKRVWMEQGANTTYVRYRLLRGRAPAALALDALVNYRDAHSLTRSNGWRMMVTTVTHGLRVLAFEGARPLVILAEGAAAEPAHTWYERFDLPREHERGLDAREDHLHAGTLRASLAPGGALTVVLSAEASPSLDGSQARRQRERHEKEVLRSWRRRQPAARHSPAWLAQLVLAADQFISTRSITGGPDETTIVAGYPWFGDWGRDTMIALAGLTLVTGRAEIARRILTTWARFVDHGMLPNRFPDAGGPPDYTTADAALWYVEAAHANAGFERFWNERSGCCYDVLDGPDGHDDTLRPNQLLAVALPESPLARERQRRVVDVCARHLLTSYGLRTLAPDHPHYQGRYAGGPRERDSAYHQGTVWAWLLGPFAVAHFKVHGDAETARSFLMPLADHLGDYGVGSVAEVFDGDPPFTPRGAIAQAWSVAEALRAWHQIGD